MWLTACKLDIELAILAWSDLINCEIVVGEETFFQVIIFHISNVSLEILLPQIPGENHNNRCEWEVGWSMQKFFLIKISGKGLKISLSWTTRQKIKEWDKDEQGCHSISLAENTCAFVAQQKATYRQKLFSTRGRKKDIHLPSFKNISHIGLWPACQWEAEDSLRRWYKSSSGKSF